MRQRPRPAVRDLRRARWTNSCFDTVGQAPVRIRVLAAHHHVRDRESTARFEHTERFTQHCRLVRRQVDHTVGDDHVDRCIGQRDVLDVPLQKLDVRHARLALVLPRQLEHRVRHVETVGLATRCDAARGEQHIDSAAGAEIEDGFSRGEVREGGGITAAE